MVLRLTVCVITICLATGRCEALACKSLVYFKTPSLTPSLPTLLLPTLLVKCVQGFKVTLSPSLRSLLWNGHPSARLGQLSITNKTCMLVHLCNLKHALLMSSNWLHGVCLHDSIHSGLDSCAGQQGPMCHVGKLQHRHLSIMGLTVDKSTTHQQHTFSQPHSTTHILPPATLTTRLTTAPTTAFHPTHHGCVTGTNPLATQRQALMGHHTITIADDELWGRVIKGAFQKAGTDHRLLLRAVHAVQARYATEQRRVQHMGVCLQGIMHRCSL